MNICYHPIQLAYQSVIVYYYQMSILWGFNSKCTI